MQRTIFTILALIPAIACAQPIQDNFDRPDSTTVTGWTEVVGDWQIVGNRLHAQSTSTFQDITFDASSGTTDSTITSVVSYSPIGAAIRYIGHVHRHDGVNRVFMKVQDNSSAGNYNRAFVYEGALPGSGTQRGFYDIITPFTTAIIQTELVGTSLTLRIDQNMDSVWDETHVFSPLALVLGAGRLGVCGYNNGIIDDWDATGMGFGGPAILEADVIDAASASVQQGETGVVVTMSVNNLGMDEATNLVGSLRFFGTADRTTEYTVTPDPANPTSVLAGATAVLTFFVDVAQTATIETVTIDGDVGGVDAFTMLPIVDIDANTPDSWQVLYTCFAPSCGDCNGDLIVTVLDALVAAQHSAGLVTLTGVEFTNCNVIGLVEPDPMAEVTVIDALTLAQSAAGLPVTLACC